MQENHIIVIFGASGDLTKRKLIPALYSLYLLKLLPQKYHILGVGRTELTDDEFRKLMAEALNEKKKESIDNIDSEPFLNKLSYLSIETSDEAEYSKLKDRLSDLDSEDSSILFYLATPPHLYKIIPGFLAKNKLNRADHKLIVEKPFGYDLESARDLNIEILNHFNEDQIYRIDHYLGKETVQNIMVTRFSNTIFEPLWNRNYIHHVEITSAESLGVEKRGGYYEKSGALRDMVQNHLLQLAALVAMEPPVVAGSEPVRNEVLKVFQSFRPLEREAIIKDIIRGQYLNSRVNGKEIAGYRQEDEVDANSRTETYVAMKFFIDNWRWSGVPFYIRTGKYLPTRVTEIVIHFKPTPHHLFLHAKTHLPESNQLVIRIQPDEGLLLKFGMKVPGMGVKVQNVNMDFHYSSLANIRIPEAYERLLLDCLSGDSTLYSRADGLDASWAFIDPIIKVWENDPSIPLYGYPAGTWGPDVADNLIEEPWLTWRYPCKNLSDDGIYCEL
jgi:glucose-6-phosphate 1-dehydrogenase